MQSGGSQYEVAIDDDVQAAVRELATTEQESVGEMISALARRALRPANTSSKTRNGVPLIHSRLDAQRVTSELVRQLDEELR